MARKSMSTITRVRLLERLADAPRFTLVRAPAGFGKSTLLDQLEARLGRDAAQAVRIDLSADNSGEAYLRAAIARALGLRGDVDYRALADALEAGGWPMLLIDNADHLARSPEARRLLERLSTDLEKLKTILASRGDTGLPLARYAASGELLQIGPQAMLFDGEEQLAALENLGGGRYSTQQLELICAATSGWPCGVGLQAQSGTDAFLSQDPVKADHPSGTVIKGTWRLLADYFRHEVMSGLPDELQRFLVRASILEDLRVQDTEALLGDEGPELLDRAYALGVPLWADDPEHHSYTMLPIFRQFLRSRLDDRDAAKLGAKACDLLEEREQYRAACIQALSFGDHVRAARLLELQLRADFGLRDETKLLGLAEQIDRNVRERHPRILLAFAQSLIFKFEFEKARQCLDLARAIVEKLSGRDGGDPSDIQSLEMLLLHREMVLALGQHDLSRAQDYGDQLLRDMESVPPMQRVMILNSLTYAQQELYIFRSAERYYVQAKKLIPLLESWISSVPLETFYARHLFQTGRTMAAIGLLEVTLAKLVAELGPKPILGTIAAIALAEMKFEIGDTEEAGRLLADYGAGVENFGFLSLTIAARITQARLHMAAGEHDAGFAVLERPTIGAGELFDKLFRALNVERIYWLMRLGREDAARLPSAALGLSLTRPPGPHSSAASAEEAYAAAWIQLARANRRIEEAIHVAQKWQRHTEGVGAVRSSVRWNVILASLRTLAEEPGLAMRHLRRAIKLGATGQYRGTFLDEADVLQEQLVMLIDSDLEETESEFVRSILHRPKAEKSATDSRAIPLPLGTFSSRETAILRLLAKGLMNKEIGDTLGMTEGTVKWYLHRIYDKLGVRRRSQVAMLVTQWHARAAERGVTSSVGRH